MFGAAISAKTDLIFTVEMFSSVLCRTRPYASRKIFCRCQKPRQPRVGGVSFFVRAVRATQQPAFCNGHEPQNNSEGPVHLGKTQMSKRRTEYVKKYC
jgi:hypothetical protein